MSKFTPNVERDFEFEGDTVHVVARRFTREHMRKIVASGATTEFEQTEAVLKLLPEVLTITGLKAGDKELGITDILDEMYFNEFLNKVAMWLAKESGIKLPGGEEGTRQLGKSEQASGG